MPRQTAICLPDCNCIKGTYMTQKLYDQNVYLAEFTAEVEEIRQEKDGYAVLLNQTAFFPEGGGQSADEGTVDGIEVLDVKEEGGLIWHYMKEAPKGKKVNCAVNFTVRFRRMQSHTGEHILSGIATTLHGCHNVGFHIGREDMTVDYDMPLSEQQIRNLEWLSNKAIYENRSVRAYYPEKDALASLPYRSKKEIDGAVRLVEIDGIDLCACCAPHVAKTGEVGVLRIVSFEKYKGGVRLHIHCGYEALEDAIKKEADLRAMSVLLSAKVDQLPEALERLLAENNALKKKNADLRTALLAKMIETAKPEQGNIMCFMEEMDAAGMRQYVNNCLQNCSKFCGFFAGNDEKGYTFTLSAAPAVSLPACAASLREKLGAKCGGSPQMINGTVCATKDAIVSFFSSLTIE